ISFFIRCAPVNLLHIFASFLTKSQSVGLANCCLSKRCCENDTYTLRHKSSLRLGVTRFSSLNLRLPPSRRTSFLLTAKPALAFVRLDHSVVVIALAGYVVDPLAGGHADIALDAAV